ncbi:MAG TPA: squalene synthase HpnC [Gammaproteobacteria bacterium]|nr:squalene synthase HpnC [Gammaproteobacteria bacterium]
MGRKDARLAAAYDHCLAVARSHYENFPVASRLLPARLRRPVAVIYAFARRADDFADEGSLAAERRLRLLDAWQSRLEALARGEVVDEPVFIALADVARRHDLPWTLFTDLLSAFRQDVTLRRYQDFRQVLDYCRRSANPIGRLLLHLDGQATADNLKRSDALCTALQLINFLQDIRQDYEENDRVYLPLADMAPLGIVPEDIGAGRDDVAMRHLIRRQTGRIRKLLHEGAPLARRLRGRLGLELRLTVAGARRIVHRLETAESCYARPRLKRRDWLAMAWTLWRLPGSPGDEGETLAAPVKGTRFSSPGR